MDFLDPHIEFDPDGPFHGLVVAYAAETHGLLDLAARGVRAWYRENLDPTKPPEVSEEEMIAAVCAGVAEGYREHARAVLRSDCSPLLGVQSAGSLTDAPLRIDTAQLAAEIYDRFLPAASVFNQVSAGSLLVMAWETTRHTRHPLWEFLRHCRNAAAHGGRFHFRAGEPSRPAKWRDLAITRSLRARPLFPSATDAGFIGPGDVLYLLGDIEARFFSAHRTDASSRRP